MKFRDNDERVNIDKDDNTVNILVAEKVAGWTHVSPVTLCRYKDGYPVGNHPVIPLSEMSCGGRSGCQKIPDYLNDASATIKLLRMFKCTAENFVGEEYRHSKWVVKIKEDEAGKKGYGEAETFCHAACLAMLNYRGVTALLPTQGERRLLEALGRKPTAEALEAIRRHVADENLSGTGGSCK
jgi:hypothetical protein